MSLLFYEILKRLSSFSYFLVPSLMFWLLTYTKLKCIGICMKNRFTQIHTQFKYKKKVRFFFWRFIWQIMSETSAEIQKLSFLWQLFLIFIMAFAERHVWFSHAYVVLQTNLHLSLGSMTWGTKESSDPIYSLYAAIAYNILLPTLTQSLVSKEACKGEAIQCGGSEMTATKRRSFRSICYGSKFTSCQI